MNFTPEPIPAPYDKVLIVMLASWVLVSVCLTLFPRRFFATLTRGAIILSTPAIWIWRILGLVNMIGAVRFLILFRK